MSWLFLYHMATVLGNNQVKLSNGQTVSAQQGGWYDGQQYWGGALSATGVINTKSNQQGAGQVVSAEVQKQSNPSGPVITGYTSTAQVQSALNAAQNGVYQNYQAPDGPKVQTTGEIAADLKATGLLPTDQRPQAASMVDTYKTLSEQQGLTGLEATINDLKAQEDQVAAQFRTNAASERGKPVATNVISGRVGEQQRTAQEQLDFIGRQKARAVDQYNAALNTVKMIMDFTQKDYENASASYDAQFKDAITTINLIHGIQQDQKTDAQRFQDTARANAQIYVNALKDGSIDLSRMAPEQQAQLSKLEVQAGFPIGFFASIKKDPKADIVATSNYQGQTQVLLRNPDGSISVQTYGTSGGSGSGAVGSKTVKALTADIKSGASLKEIISKYKGAIADNTIISTYNVSSPYGPAKENAQQIATMLGNTKAVPFSNLPTTDKSNINKIKDGIKQGQFSRDDAAGMFPEYSSYF